MSEKSIAKCYVDIEVVDGFPTKSTIKGNVNGTFTTVCTLIKLIAEATNVTTQEVLIDVADAVAFAENPSDEVIEQIKIMMEAHRNE